MAQGTLSQRRAQELGFGILKQPTATANSRSQSQPTRPDFIVISPIGTSIEKQPRGQDGPNASAPASDTERKSSSWSRRITVLVGILLVCLPVVWLVSAKGRRDCSTSFRDGTFGELKACRRLLSDRPEQGATSWRNVDIHEAIMSRLRASADETTGQYREFMLALAGEASVSIKHAALRPARTRKAALKMRGALLKAQAAAASADRLLKYTSYGAILVGSAHARANATVERAIAGEKRVLGNLLAAAAVLLLGEGAAETHSREDVVGAQTEEQLLSRLTDRMSAAKEEASLLAEMLNFSRRESGRVADCLEDVAGETGFLEADRRQMVRECEQQFLALMRRLDVQEGFFQCYEGLR